MVRVQGLVWPFVLLLGLNSILSTDEGRASFVDVLVVIEFQMYFWRIYLVYLP